MASAEVSPPALPDLMLTNRQLFRSNRHVGLGRAANALIKTDRRSDRLLNHRVADQIVRRKRLLDHGETEVVEPAKHFHVLQPQFAFTVNVKRLGRKLAPHDAKHLDCPAGTELELYARKTRLERFADLLDKCLDRLHLVERRADLDRRSLAAEQFVERLVLQTRVEIPPRNVEGRLGELIAAKSGQVLREGIARIDREACQAGRDPIAKHGERAGSPLAIERRIAWAGLTPTNGAAAGHANENRFEGVARPARNGSRLLQRKGRRGRGRSFQFAWAA